MAVPELIDGLFGAGAFSGVLLSTLLLRRGMKKGSPRAELPLGIFVLLVTLALLTMIADVESTALGRLPETLLTVMAGPVFFWAVAALLTTENTWRNFGLTSVTAGLLSAPLLLVGPLIAAAAWQAGFTVAAWLLYLKSGENSPDTNNGRWRRYGIVILLLIAMSLVHVLQLLRILPVGNLPHEVLLVPVLLTAGIFLLAFRGLDVSGFLQTPSPLSKSGKPDHDLAGRIEESMEEEHVYLDPDLSLRKMARTLETTPNRVSATINGIHGMRFTVFVSQHRARHAARLLADPSESRTSVEAIGLMSGFRSRSAFYTAFREHFDRTPAQYREDASGQQETGRK